MPIDMSGAVAAKAPPRKRSSTSGAAPKTAVASTLSPYERRVEGLGGLGQIAQLACIMAGQFADAAAIGKFGPPVISEVAKLAEIQPAVAKVADFFIETGPYIGLVGAIAPLALQIAANHRILDAEKLTGHGVVSPEILESQMKSEMARMQAESLRDQVESARAAKAAQEEYAAMIREMTHEYENYKNEEEPVPA